MEILASRVLFRPVDYQRTLRFYRDEIGLAIARDYGAGVVFYAGQALIELAGQREPGDPGSPSPEAAVAPGPPVAPVAPVALWLQVRDVAATQAELESRGVPIARTARREPWGLHEMQVKDPDGVTLIFVEVPPDHPLRRDVRQDAGINQANRDTPGKQGTQG